MALYILEDSANVFFKQASTLESSDPSGIWRHFDFKNKKTVLGIFESNKDSDKSLERIITPHQDFFSYFLGQFSPENPETISIASSTSFYEFCSNLNTLLVKNVKVYDLSVKNKWIWHEGDDFQIPKKLNEYIN